MLEPLQRRVDRACGDISLKPGLNRSQNRATVRPFVETQHFKENCLLECSKYVRHDDYIVGIQEAVSSHSRLRISTATRRARSSATAWRR